MSEKILYNHMLWFPGPYPPYDNFLVTKVVTV